MKKLNELSKQIQNPVFVDSCPWHESTYLTAQNLFPPQLSVPASDKTPPSYASVVAKCCVSLHCRRPFSLYCRAKKVHDSRLMTGVFCNNFLILFESYGRQLREASIQSGSLSALAIAVADMFRIPFGIATSASFSPFYNFSSPYYGDEVWCSFDVSPLCGPVQGGVLWVDTHHAWMFNACQRIVDAVLSNVRPLCFVVLVTDATRRWMDLLLCGHQKHPSVIALSFHITDARVPTYHADAMTTKLCSHIHGFLLQSRCAIKTDPVDNHDVAEDAWSDT